MAPKGERFISFHIPKTAGTSLLRFYRDLYGEAYVYNLNWPSVPQNRLRTAIKRGIDGYRLLRRHIFPSIYTKNEELQRISPDNLSWKDIAPDWKVIHGHFQPDEVPYEFLENTKLTIVFQEPLKRVVSHYNYWISKPAATVGNRWFASTMSIDEFILRDEMTNYQSAFIHNRSLDCFDIVGLTEHLGSYVTRFNPSGGVILRRLNENRSGMREYPSQDAIEEFIKKNRADYALYGEALKLAI